MRDLPLPRVFETRQTLFHEGRDPARDARGAIGVGMQPVG